MGEFGDRLRRTRREANLTQEDLADRLGLTQVAISQLERGVRSPTPAIVERLAQVLEIDKSVLTGESEGQFERQVLYRNVEGMSPETLRKMNELIEALRKEGK